MPHSICNCQYCKSHIDQQRYMGVSQVMHSDSLYPRSFRSSVHLMMEIRFGNHENPFVLFRLIQHFQIILHLITQKLGDAYRHPLQQDLVSVSVSIPLIDWGVRKGKYNMARNNLNVVGNDCRWKAMGVYLGYSFGETR